MGAQSQAEVAGSRVRELGCRYRLGLGQLEHSQCETGLQAWHCVCSSPCAAAAWVPDGQALLAQSSLGSGPLLPPQPTAPLHSEQASNFLALATFQSSLLSFPPSFMQQAFIAHLLCAISTGYSSEQN